LKVEVNHSVNPVAIFSLRVGKNGGVQGEEIFCPRAISETRRPRVARSRAEHFCFSLIEFFRRRTQIKKCKVKCSARQQFNLVLFGWLIRARTVVG